MEKIKMNYIHESIYFLCVFLVSFPIAVWLGINTVSQAPIMLVLLSGIIVYFYITDKIIYFGYSIGVTGISFYKKNKPIVIGWNHVSIQKDFFGQKIILGDTRKSFYIATVYRNSIIKLIKKYCPTDHELYKTIEEFSASKNIPF